MSFRSVIRRVLVPARRASLAGFAVLVASAGMAEAQSPVCGQIRAELAQLGPSRGGGGGGATRDSMRLRQELSRIQLAIQQNDCNRSGFILFNQPPAVCAPLKAQAGQYAAQIRAMEGGGADPSSPRRAQLISALDRYGCNGQQPQQQRGVIYAAPNEPGLAERLFGQTSVDGQRDVPPGSESLRDLENDQPPRERLGGRTAVCVRTCDGYFFPVNFGGIGARDEYSQVCQRLCPSAETQVFFMPLGAEIDRAAARDGTPYMSLPAAKRFQTSRDSACFCKQPSQTWASISKGFEDLVEARKGDIVVTEEQALAMSRPKGLQTPADRKGKKGEQPKTAARITPEEPADGLPDEMLPTGGNASSGIGPRISRTAPTTMAPVDPARGTVRNVAPGLVVRDKPADLRGAVQP
ncbi:MAG: hypothetical protein CFE31_06925 [Rhizobiales bacterium PAR1]|nr:MAG: hypothetical protein CFE31_06925 [Rhizobiales bacterium PAR1]